MTKSEICQKIDSTVVGKVKLLWQRYSSELRNRYTTKHGEFLASIDYDTVFKLREIVSLYGISVEVRPTALSAGIVTLVWN